MAIYLVSQVGETLIFFSPSSTIVKNNSSKKIVKNKKQDSAFLHWELFTSLAGPNS